ncbi:small GTP-binding protein [Caldicellulosiruptor saccharolyticus DSM 8903]|uniref:Ferrous iron transport protein B n=1 Tax=Caldicellulosiruptor saccharolyticus (strain ATCC 43494 / DSM 8903 / Tp8T 6331) TaxID=351627 RepID=A4XK92_CALS8|nr:MULTISPECIES: ferrous iron transport protein B [Caldicellulosiruptor]ABP67327.1 small GTP-binding protein [Caldicellulosiruptor saccharolyticus DSM 8903]
MHCHCQSFELLKLPQDKEVIALVGNPNVGKSVVFSKLTGKYVEVSNFPGTTVDINYGFYKNYVVIDTPGVYGISSFNDEEIVTRDIVLSVDKVINVVDALHLDRDLFLTQQLIDYQKDIIVVLNMFDEVKKNDMKIDIDALKKTLGVEVIVTSATKAEGIEKLQEAIDKNLFRKGNPTPQLQKLLQEAGMEFSKDGLATAENIFNPSISELQEKIYSLRRSHVDKIFEKAVRFDTKKLEIKNRISEILVNPITGIPILAATLYIMYYFMGVLVAQRVVDFTMNKVMGEYYLGFVKGLLTPFVKNIYIQKILIGNYGLLSMFPVVFLGLLFPLVVAFHLFMSILEDSGYLPRIAALVDKVFNKIGLNGRAIIPIILGFGCVTMATMTTRILGSKRERVITMFLLGLAIPCSAQLGIISGLIARLGYWYLVIYILIIGLVFGIVGRILNKVIQGSSTSLFIDLPTLRIPLILNVIKKTYYKSKNFLIEALPIFVLATLILGFLDATGFLKIIENIAQPIVTGFLKLPKRMTEVFILSIIRRDYGAAGLVTIPTTKRQMFVALVTTTLFVPCITSFAMMTKENGLKYSLFIWVSSAVIAILVGGLLAHIMIV